MHSVHTNKVVTSSFFLLTCIRSLFIHCAATELTGIFSDIMNLKGCVGFSDFLVLPQQRLLVGVISAMVEKELGKLNFCFDSEVKFEPLHRGERDCCRMRYSCQFTSGPCYFSDAPLFRPLGRMRTPPAGLLPLLRHRRSENILRTSTENIFLECRLCLLLLGRRGQPEVAL
jgi:hypothetical protein